MNTSFANARATEGYYAKVLRPVSSGASCVQISISIARLMKCEPFGAGAWLTWLLDPTKGSLSEMYSGYYSSLIRDLKAD